MRKKGECRYEREREHRSMWFGIPSGYSVQPKLAVPRFMFSRRAEDTLGGGEPGDVGH